MGSQPTAFPERLLVCLLSWALVSLTVAGCKTPQPTEIVVKPKSSAYDRVLTDTVQERWHDLLKANPELAPVQGHVVVRFKLHSDGKVSDLLAVETTVPPAHTILCEKAIRDPAPFGEWSREMRIAVGRDERSMTFTFHYDAQRPRTIRDALRLQQRQRQEQ